MGSFYHYVTKARGWTYDPVTFALELVQYRQLGYTVQLAIKSLCSRDLSSNPFAITRLFERASLL